MKDLLIVLQSMWNLLLVSTCVMFILGVIILTFINSPIWLLLLLIFLFK